VVAIVTSIGWKVKRPMGSRKYIDCLITVTPQSKAYVK
jgi:hypothetical protein